MAYKKKSKKAKKLNIKYAVVHVKATFNNTLVSITTPEGDVLFSSSAGKLGFKGTRIGTPFAASQIGSSIVREAEGFGVKSVDINLQGPGFGRDSVIRAIQASDLEVSVLRDVTPLPHNGGRPPKKRRV